MFSLSSSNQYYLYAPATDMRMGFDSLCGLVLSKLKLDPRSGKVFIFLNKRRTTIKLLHWEMGGLVLYHKRLEAGTFEMPSTGDPTRPIGLDWAMFVMLVEGVSIKGTSRRKRYVEPEKTGF